MDEQMIADIAKAIARASIEAAEPQTGRLTDVAIEQLVEYFSLRCYPEARAAHSVIAGRVAELEGALKAARQLAYAAGRDDLVAEFDAALAHPKARNEQECSWCMGVREPGEKCACNTLTDAALAPYPERRSE